MGLLTRRAVLRFFKFECTINAVGMFTQSGTEGVSHYVTTDIVRQSLFCLYDSRAFHRSFLSCDICDPGGGPYSGHDVYIEQT